MAKEWRCKVEQAVQVALRCRAEVEHIDLADSVASDSSRADAKRDLVWQLELERLRNATLKLEVQREICEGSDLRKRLQETETDRGQVGIVRNLAGASRTVLVPAMPTSVSVCGPVVQGLTTVPSVARLATAGCQGLTTVPSVARLGNVGCFSQATPTSSSAVSPSASMSLASTVGDIDVAAAGLPFGVMAASIPHHMEAPAGVQQPAVAVPLSSPVRGNAAMHFSPRHRTALTLLESLSRSSLAPTQNISDRIGSLRTPVGPLLK